MLNRIMVPTDGSTDSVNAVPVAQQIARAQGAEILLIRVVQPIAWETETVEAPVDPDVYEGLMGSIEEQARDDVERLRASVEAQGVKARALVPRGFATHTLLDCEQSEQPDLVVMATHGRTGITRFALGSIADRMVREGLVPVLLVRRSTAMDAVIATAVVMLDGSGAAECALPIVEILAGKPLRSVTLFQSVTDPDDREPAMTYLKAVATRLARPDFAVETVVDVGDPGMTVRRVAQEHGLVILSTHGRGGIDRLRHGSVAEAVVREIDNPVLLVRAFAQ